MKIFFLTCLLLVLQFDVFAQSKATTSFVIKGDIKSEITITVKELRSQKLHSIGTIDITNHKGEIKGSAKDMKGILLRELIQSVSLNVDNPKYYSEYYFVCTGTDNYKVVYSWNELFNTAVGDKVFIVTEKDGQNMLDNEDGLLMISSDDRKTGRRFVKNLETIEVRRVQ